MTNQQRRLSNTLFSLMKDTIKLKNGRTVEHYEVELCPRALRKMMQAQANMLRLLHAGYAPRRRFLRRRFLYWSRQFTKWCDILITRPLRKEGYERT